MYCKLLWSQSQELIEAQNQCRLGPVVVPCCAPAVVPYGVVRGVECQVVVVPSCQVAIQLSSRRPSRSLPGAVVLAHYHAVSPVATQPYRVRSHGSLTVETPLSGFNGDELGDPFTTLGPFLGGFGIGGDGLNDTASSLNHGHNSMARSGDCYSAGKIEIEVKWSKRVGMEPKKSGIKSSRGVRELKSAGRGRGEERSGVTERLDSAASDELASYVHRQSRSGCGESMKLRRKLHSKKLRRKLHNVD
ncbi:hypothetical protein RHMOL_Rhmol09G0160100 [Rhododendron molle]|uniref:Uncharacterized protein n=1 Tax=Rhododendron molle TaxID=49168 RepID=A0ACC0MEZ6_RHOML|nr:hypothetical protein RHMOL_Rhmol09G0160100 [Rhododendron molle]